MSRPGFLDVSGVQPMSGKFVPGEGTLTDGILIRDYSGRVVDTLLIMGDGHFRSPFGRVHRDDVGEYVIRVSGHPVRGKLDEQPLAPQARKA